jgi:hypothetical protein
MVAARRLQREVIRITTVPIKELIRVGSMVSAATMGNAPITDKKPNARHKLVIVLQKPWPRPVVVRVNVWIMAVRLVRPFNVQATFVRMIA